MGRQGSARRLGALIPVWLSRSLAWLGLVNSLFI